MGDAKQDECYLEGGHEYPVESSNTFELPVPNQALGDDESLCEFDIALGLLLY